MNELEQKKYEIFIKAIGVAAVLIGGGIGLWKHFDVTEQEFRQPYWEKQIEVYFSATEVVGSLATSTNQKVIREASADFWQLYYGPLSLVEDRQVELAMVAVGKCLRRNCNQRELQPLSLKLARACRESLGNSWSVTLEQLTGDRS